MKKIKLSPALNTLYTILKDRRWHTTSEIQDRSRALAASDPQSYRRICTVNTTVTDLRRKNLKVDCRPKGRGVYEYRYTGKAA